MVVIQRSDEQCLNFSAGRTFNNIPGGVLIDMGDEELYLIKDVTVNHIRDLAKGRFGAFVTIHAEWEGWPQ